MTTKPPYLTLVSPEESEREEHAKPCSPGVGTLTLRRERCHDQTSPDTTEFDQDEALSRNLPALFASLPESFWAELESPKSTRITWQAASQHGTRELTTARGTTLTVIDPDALLSTPFEELGVHDAMHRVRSAPSVST